MVKAVILMAAELGMDVVAEGVETEEQVATLVEAGCRLMQGYLFGKPVPVSQQAHRTDAQPVTHLTGTAAHETGAQEPIAPRATTFKRTA